MTIDTNDVLYFKSKLHQIEDLIAKFDLNLSGLSVYTEAASGAYLLNPIIAALAGAEHVYIQAANSRFGMAADVLEATFRAADFFGVAHRFTPLLKRCHESLGKSNIITNSGFVRPIDLDLIRALKRSAVIPLMWETWEYRSADFDLKACKDSEILVLGTNEKEPPCDMRDYVSWTALKLIFDLGFDGGKIIVLGNGDIPAAPIVDGFRRLGIETTWVSDDVDGDIGYAGLKEYFRNNGKSYDIIFVAEHRLSEVILGIDGFLDFNTILAINPGIKVGIMCGNIDEMEIGKSGLTFKPHHLAPVGFLSYQPYMMGARPVLLLFAAGLKVGEVMANARISGMNIRDSAIYALAHSPAMDFQGDLSWT